MMMVAVMGALHLALQRLQGLLRAREIAGLQRRSNGCEPLLKWVARIARAVRALRGLVLNERGVGRLGTRKVARLQRLSELLKTLARRILLRRLVGWCG